MNVWVIGCGGIGTAHSNAYKLLDDVNIVLMVDLIPERAEKLAAEHGAKTGTSWQGALEDALAGRIDRPDYVDLCIPSDMHADLAITFLDAGFPVLCEKPMANRLGDARRMLEASKRAGVPFMIAQVIRFWPEYGFLKQVYDDGRYGRLLSVSFTRICQVPAWGDGWYIDPARSGMAPFELHIHDEDFVHYMFGMPDSVESYGFEDYGKLNSILKTRYFYEGVDALIEAEAGWYLGALSFTANYRAVFDDAVLILEKGVLTVYDKDGKVFTPELNQVEVASNINLKSAGGMYHEIRYFADCVKQGRMPEMITPEQSAETIRLMYAELESASTKKRVELKSYKGDGK